MLQRCMLSKVKNIRERRRSLLKKIVIWMIIILITLLLPFVLQWVLMNETIFPLDIKIYFTREKFIFI